MKIDIRELLLGILGNIISTVAVAIIGFFVAFFGLNLNLSVLQAIVGGFYVFIIIITLHFLTTKRQSQIQPSTKLYRYSPRSRIIISIISILAIVLVALLIHPSPFTIPMLEVRFINNQSNDISIHNRGEFILISSTTPLSDTLIASGVIKLQLNREIENNDQTEILVPSKGEIVVYVNIINPLKYRKFLENEDTYMDLFIYQKNGEMIDKQGIPFDSNTLANFYVALETREGIESN